MDKLNKISISCENCGREFEIEYKTEFYTNDYNDIVMSIVNETIFEYACPYCGENNIFKAGSVYINEEKKFKVYLDSENRLMSLKSDEDGYRIIGTSSYVEWVNLITALENDLKHYSVGIYKEMISKKIKASNKESNVEKLCRCLIRKNNELKFLVVSVNKETESWSASYIKFDKNIYNGINTWYCFSFSY